MGILKIEIDLPNFEKEIKFDITIKKDGEVLSSTSPTLNDSNIREVKVKAVSDNFGEEVVAETKKVPAKKSKISGSGNFMNLENI